MSDVRETDKSKLNF